MTSAAVAPANSATKPATLLPNMYHVQHQPNQNVAPASTTKNYEYPPSKGKKSWSVRLGLSGRQKVSEEESAEGGSRGRGWGTVNGGGSVLSRQMMYGEPWLYGTVRSSRGVYDARAILAAPTPSTPLLLVCSCPEFLGGTTRRIGGACPKCGTHRLLGLAMGGTCRLPPSTPARPRPSLAGVLRPSVDDPYDLMRRSRLAEPRSRARSTSPQRPQLKKDIRVQSSMRTLNNYPRLEWIEKEPTPEELEPPRSRLSYEESADEWAHTPGFGTVDRRNFPQGYPAKATPKTTGTERVPRSPKKLPVQQAPSADPSESLGNNRNNNSNNNNNNNNNISKNAKNQMKNDKEEDWRQKLNGDSRRSILECDVNPYMLLKKSKEDDSSDDLSDNALELEERRGPSLFDPSKVKSIERIPNRSAVAAIGGQRIRVFNEPRGHSDDEDFPVTRIPIPKISPKRPPRRLKEVGQTLKSILKRGKVLESKRRKNVLFNVDNVIFAPEKPAARFSWPDLGESTREEAVDDWRESFEEDRDEEAERGEESQEREPRKEIDPATPGVSEEPDQEGEPKPAARTHRRQYNFITIPNIREPKVTRPVEAKSEKVPGSLGDRPPRRLDGPSFRSKLLKSDETKTTLDDVLEEAPEPVSEGKPEERKIERPKVPFSSNIAVDEKDLILKSEENRRRSLLIRSQSERSCASRPEVTAGSVQFADTMRLNLSKRTKSSGTGSEVTETHPQTRDSICRLILRSKSPSRAPDISELSVDPSGSPEVRAENLENHEASARSEIQVAQDPKEEVAKPRELTTSDERSGGSGSPGVLETRHVTGSTKSGESSAESRVLEESLGVEGGTKPVKHFQRMRPTSWSPPPGRQKHQKRNETTVKIRQEPASPVQGQSNGGGWIEKKKDEQGSGELSAGGGIKIQQETSGAFQVQAAAVRQDRRSSYPENFKISGCPPIIPPPPQKVHQHRKSEPSLSAVKIHQRDVAGSPKHLTLTAVTSCRVEPSRIEVVQEKPRVSDLSSSSSNICKITVSPRVPAMVHRLQVGVQEPAQRTPARTSIIINGNQDPSPESVIDNKVTISVGGEDSVCNPTVISVGSDVPAKIQSPQENRRTLVILDNNNRSNIVLASDGFNQLNGRRGEVGGKVLEKAEVEQESKHARPVDEAGSCANLEQDRDKISRKEEEGEGEKPVSATKRRNRPDPEAATSGSVLGPSKEAIISKLLEDSLKKARENGEILDEGSGEAILRILKQSLLKGKEYESSESTIEASYSSKSSSLTSEPDFNSGNLFLEENLYEMIKEPIYEEIPEDPPLPPLPSCPPPSEHHHHRHHHYDKSFFGEPELYYYKNTLESYVNSDVFGKPFPGDLGDFYLSKNLKGSCKKVNSSVEEEEEEEDDDDEEDEENISRKFELLNFLIDAKPKKSEDDDEEVEDDEERENAERDLEALYEQKETSLGDLSSKSSQISNISDSSEECNIILTSSPELLKTRPVDIERTDSGVGSESSHASSTRGAPRRWRTGSLASPVTGSLRTGIPQTTSGDAKLCEDCEQRLDPLITDSGVVYAPFVCRKCSKKRAERKEIITEIVETEQKYGRDLQIILDEFHRPMLKAGLLNPEQLTAIFLNVEELLEHNLVLAEKLKDAVEIAQESGDEDLLTVDVGKIFLESERMLHAFESYCTRQGTASLLLQNLEKEKELLRIFLRVSQMENTVLRRMNLNSFLMVPVQRVTKYPLLLARLLKATPSVRPDIQEAKTKLKQAQTNIELHLEHMNAEAKDITSTKLWRRISIIQNGRRPTGEQDIVNIKLRKMAVEILEWAHEETRFVLEGRLLVAQPTDNNWRRGRTIKLAPVTAMLVTNGKSSIDYHDFNDDSLFSKHIGVKEATLLLVKEKIGRYSLLREPLYLDKCIVCCEADFEDYFEIQELSSKETFILKAEDGTRTKRWCRILQAHAQSLGAWRKRRGALPNIMICSVARN